MVVVDSAQGSAACKSQTYVLAVNVPEVPMQVWASVVLGRSAKVHRSEPMMKRRLIRGELVIEAELEEHDLCDARLASGWGRVAIGKICQEVEVAADLLVVAVKFSRIDFGFSLDVRIV